MTKYGVEGTGIQRRYHMQARQDVFGLGNVGP